MKSLAGNGRKCIIVDKRQELIEELDKEMARMNFFERMEREIDFQQEYLKIEDIVLNESSGGYRTIEEDISKAFRNWKDRGNFISFLELRKYLGFSYYYDTRRSGKCVPTGEINGMMIFSYTVRCF